jgi:transposase
MEQRKAIIGIDVSKATLDIFIRTIDVHFKVSNNSEGFKKLLALLKANKLDPKNFRFVLEYTGGYEYRLVQFCQAKQYEYVRVSGLALKRSMGLVRGKSDKIDAKRIAEYGEEKQLKMKAEAGCMDDIVRLKRLLSQRDAFVTDKKAYDNRLSELQYMMELPDKDSMLKRYKICANNLIKMIEATETEIRKLIAKNDKLQSNLELLTSIKGVGEVNGWAMIAYTENFTSFDNARQFGAFAGVVPYPFSSGTSIKGKSRTSKMANQWIKSLLHMAARAAVQHDEEIKQYYQRRIAMEKKHMAVMNEIMFKLVLRMFAIVKKQEPYVDKFKKAA